MSIFSFNHYLNAAQWSTHHCALVLGWLFAGTLLPAQAGVANPDRIAWVWHSSGAPNDVSGIALLLDQLTFSGDDIKIRPRRTRLFVAPGVKVTPVVHVQLDLAHLPRLGAQHTAAINKAVQAAYQKSTSGWVQLDFEALESQRDYYFGLVAGLKRVLPAAAKLSATVLPSWCIEPGLLEQLAADEVVPMFFRMGPAADTYQSRLRHPEQLAPRCRTQAIGFAVQEAPPLAVQQRYHRLYWFNFKNWNNPNDTHL